MYTRSHTRGSLSVCVYYRGFAFQRVGREEGDNPESRRFSCFQPAQQIKVLPPASCGSTRGTKRNNNLSKNKENKTDLSELPLLLRIRKCLACVGFSTTLSSFCSFFELGTSHHSVERRCMRKQLQLPWFFIPF